MKQRIMTVLLAVVFLVGLVILLYPTISHSVNSVKQNRVVTSYTRNVSQIDRSEYLEILEQAREYNKRLIKTPERFLMSAEQLEEYRKLLLTGRSDVMGILEIPSLSVRLPIYHGTNEAVLQVGVGHIEGSSLPVGGLGTHAALSGHRGLPSSKLLSDIDKMKIEDTFTVKVLDEVLTYKVDQILIVDPEDMSDLKIYLDKDYLTLVTCTPYGVNSHRLLVRGIRIETVEEEEEPMIDEPVVAADEQSIDREVIIALIAVASVLIILIISILFIYIKRNGRSKRS